MHLDICIALSGLSDGRFDFYRSTFNKRNMLLTDIARIECCFTDLILQRCLF